MNNSIDHDHSSQPVREPGNEHSDALRWQAPRPRIDHDSSDVPSDSESRRPTRHGRRSNADPDTHADSGSSELLPALPSSTPPEWTRLVDGRPQSAPAPPPLFPEPAPADYGGADESVLAVLGRRKAVFLLIAILSWLSVAAYITIVPPSYEATTLLMVDTRGFRKEVEDLPRINRESAQFGLGKIANHALILQTSNELVETTVDQLLAMKHAGLITTPLTLFDGLDPNLGRASVLKRFRKKFVTVSPQPNDDDEPDAIMVSALSTEPAEAALISNLYAQSYIKSVVGALEAQYVEARQYYADLLVSQDVVMANLDSSLHAFAAKRGDIMLEEEESHTVKQISLLRSKLDDSRIEISQYEARISSLIDQFNKLEPQLHAEQAASGLDTRLQQTNARIAEVELSIEQFYTKNPGLREHPETSEDLMDLLLEAESLRLRINRLSADYVDQVVAVGGIDLQKLDSGVAIMAQLRRQIAEERVSLSAEKAREAAILTRLAQYEQQRKILPTQQVDLEKLERQHAVAETRHDELKEKIRKIDEAESSQRIFAQVAVPAVTPIEPVRAPSVIGGLGFVLGILLAIGGAFARDKTDSRIFEPTDMVPDQIDLIGTIPDLRKEHSIFRSRKSFAPFFERTVSTDLVSLLHPQSAVSHAIKSLQMRLSGDPSEMQVFVVTSPEMEDGKSMIAANFAVTLAQSGYRTLLLDADIYHPSVSRLLGLTKQAEFDLETCTFSDGRGVEAFSAALPNLYALSLHGPDNGTAEFLMSTHLVPVIERVRNHFDVVVIDTPPVTHSTDALRLGQLSDEVFLVARTGKTHFELFQKSVTDIDRAASRPPRVILNGYTDKADASKHKRRRYNKRTQHRTS